MSDDVRQRVDRVVAEKVRPGLRMDGGDIEVVEVTADGTVRVRLQGHCSGCPFSAMTLAVAVERTLKEAVPEVNKVEQVG
jgi:Fe-S cluster biogenesis protein NfuA